MIGRQPYAAIRRVFLGAAILGFAASAQLHADDQLDPHRIMLAVNKRYQSFKNEPRTVTLNQTVRLSTLDLKDTVQEEKDVIFLQGEMARFESLSVSVISAPTPGVDAKVTKYEHRRRVWIHDGKETKVIHEAEVDGPGGKKPVVEAFVVRHHTLPKDFPEKFRAPLAQNEFDQTFLDGKYYVYPSTYQGRIVYVIQSIAPIRANDQSLILNCQFWIDAKELLLLHQEMEMQEKLPPDILREPAFITLRQDMETKFGMKIDPAKFTLDLPENAKDLTQMVIDHVSKAGKK